MPGNTKKHRRGNGEGSVYQRKDGTWAAVLTVGVKPDGKPDRKFLYGKTRKRISLEKPKISLTLALSLGATMFFLVRGY